MIRSFWFRPFCDRTPLAATVKSPQAWLCRRFGLLVGSLCLTLPLWTVPAAAQFVPPDAGLPGRRASGGTRGGCAVGRPSNLIALLPDSNVGQTTQAFPTFRWYVPQSNAEAMRFQLYAADPNRTDSEGMLIYETVQPAPTEGGMVSLTLPPTGEAQPLVMGRTYRWSVDLICNAENPAGNLNIMGWVQRMMLDSEVATQLADADLEERIEIYGTNGLWFDYLDAIAALPPSEQEEADALWLSTLSTIGLDELASLYSDTSQ
ncbi:MAG: DUF928 domain-containing protein [Thainema sp.]